MFNKPLTEQFLDFLHEHNLRWLFCVPAEPSRSAYPFSTRPQDSYCNHDDEEEEYVLACCNCPCHARLPLFLGFMRAMLAQLDDEVSRLSGDQREVRSLITKFQSELHYDDTPWRADP